MKKYFQNKYSPIGLEISDDCIGMIQVKRANWKWSLHCMAEIERGNSEQKRTDSSMLVPQIKEMLRKHAFRGRQAVISLSIREVDILPVYLQVSDEDSLEEAILAGAKTRLAYPVESAVIDYLPIESQETRDGKRLFWIIAAHRDIVEQQVRQLEKAGLQSQAVDVQPCALVRAIELSGLQAEGTLLLIHIGDRNSTFLLVERNSLFAQRVCHKGYQDLVEKLSRSLRLEKDRAVKLLSEYGFSENVCSDTRIAQKDTQDSGLITGEIVMPVYGEILEDLRSFITYGHTLKRELDVKQICLSGKAGLVNSLDKMIEKYTELTTTTINPLAKAGVEGAQISDALLNTGSVFNVPLGLALRE